MAVLGQGLADVLTHERLPDPPGDWDRTWANQLIAAIERGNARSLGNLDERLRAIEDGPSGVGVSSFLELVDVTPDTYVGHAGEAPVVNAAEDGLEFFDLSGISSVVANPGGMPALTLSTITIGTVDYAVAGMGGGAADGVVEGLSFAEAAGSVTATLNRSGGLPDVIGSFDVFSGAYSDLTGLPTLFSGAYADLSGLPSLFTVVGAPTDQQVPVWSQAASQWQPGTVMAGGGGTTTTDRQRIEAVAFTAVGATTTQLQQQTLGATPESVIYGDGAIEMVAATAAETTFTILEAGVYLMEWNAVITPNADRPEPCLQVLANADDALLGETDPVYIRASSEGVYAVNRTGILVVPADNTVVKAIVLNCRNDNSFSVAAGHSLHIIRGAHRERRAAEQIISSAPAPASAPSGQGKTTAPSRRSHGTLRNSM